MDNNRFFLVSVCRGLADALNFVKVPIGYTLL